jgi:hypothetical protein
MLGAGSSEGKSGGGGSEDKGGDGECDSKVFVLVVGDDVHGKLPSITTQTGFN